MKTRVAFAIGLACLFAAGCGVQSSASHAPTDVAVAAAAQVEDAPTPTEQSPSVEPAEPAAAPAEAPAPAAAAPPASDDAPKPPAPKAQRLPADRRPRQPGEAEKITFEDLNLGMQADVAYRPFMLTDRVKELEGQRVSILGYMHEGQLSTNSVKKFVLLKNTQCKFGPGGQADHLGMIYLKEGTAAKLTNQVVKVEGKLKIEPVNVDGITWSVYDVEDATVEVVK